MFRLPFDGWRDLVGLVTRVNLSIVSERYPIVNMSGALDKAEFSSIQVVDVSM